MRLPSCVWLTAWWMIVAATVLAFVLLLPFFQARQPASSQTLGKGVGTRKRERVPDPFDLWSRATTSPMRSPTSFAGLSQSSVDDPGDERLFWCRTQARKRSEQSIRREHPMCRHRLRITCRFRDRTPPNPESPRSDGRARERSPCHSAACSRSVGKLFRAHSWNSVSSEKVLGRRPGLQWVNIPAGLLAFARSRTAMERSHPRKTKKQKTSGQSLQQRASL
jgi:hypothetical protein